MNVTNGPQPDGLSIESLGYLNYLHALLAPPAGSWDGFYVPQSPSMNFALRYQLAFGAYAVAVLATRTPAYRAPYVEALRGAIEKMLDVAAWGYWRAPAPAPQQDRGGTLAQLTNSGHMAVLVSPHTRVPAGAPSDPIVKDNLQYSGHLSTMLGLYEKLSGDALYDESFTLQDESGSASYSYTHSEVAERIYGQMRENSFGGVCCESGMAYVPCNNHALASNALHDALHGTRYTDANARWLKSVRDKMVLKGPALRGIFATCYVQDLHMGAPVAFNFTDAWGLAFMLPFDRNLVRKLYSKFKRRLTKAGSEGAYLGSAPLSEKMEISDVPINTGFALILARGMGDTSVAEAINRYSLRAFDARWSGSRYYYAGAPRTLHATALYALASAVEAGGDNFARLFNDSPVAGAMRHPFLQALSPDASGVGVTSARYSAPEKCLYISLVRVGDPAHGDALGPQTVKLTLENIESRPHVEVNGTYLPETEAIPDHAGNWGFSVPVPPTGRVACAIHI